jgi:predicted O-methyltransferase YrrM
MQQWLLTRRNRLLRVDPDPHVKALVDNRPVDPAIERLLPDGSDRAAITPELGRVLTRLVVESGVRNVLELGAGTSSVVLARAMSLGAGGRLTAIEQWPEWCAERWAQVEATPNVDARLVPARPQFAMSYVGLAPIFRKAREVVAARAPYDLVLIDAPQFYYGRDGALPLIHGHLAPGAWLVLDDARRRNERWALYRWLSTYRGLSLVYYDRVMGGRGIALLRHSGNRARRPNALSILTTGAQALRLWRLRRDRRRKYGHIGPLELH